MGAHEDKDEQSRDSDCESPPLQEPTSASPLALARERAGPAVESETQDILRQAINASQDGNPFVRDVSLQASCQTLALSSEP